MEQTCAGRTAVVIPAYKPDDRLPPYVQALKDAGIGRIAVVDDGSGEGFQGIFSLIPEDGISHIISYQPNCGKGVALKRGMAWLLDECPRSGHHRDGRQRWPAHRGGCAAHGGGPGARPLRTAPGQSGLFPGGCAAQEPDGQPHHLGGVQAALWLLGWRYADGPARLPP